MFLLVQASSRSRARPYRPSTAANHEDRSAYTLRASKPPFPFLFSLLLPTPLATRRGFTSDARRETWKRHFSTQLRNLARCSRGGETRGTVFVIFSLAYPSLSACRSEEPRRDRSRSTFPRPEAGTARGSNNRTCQRDRARGDPFPTSVCKFPSKRSPKPTRNDLLSFTGQPDGREYTMTYPRPNDWQFLNAGT